MGAVQAKGSSSPSCLRGEQLDNVSEQLSQDRLWALLGLHCWVLLCATMSLSLSCRG